MGQAMTNTAMDALVLRANFKRHTDDRLMSTVRRNVLFNYTGQFYVAIIGIITVPLYLQYMGAEAYGLIGFFTLLQAWVQLLDMGLSPTLAREVARLRDSFEDAQTLREVVRSLEVVFVCVATLVTIPLFMARAWVAERWLTVQDLDPYIVSTSIGMMTVMLGIRWLAALHRSGVNAYEKQAWLNLVNMVIVTLRFPGSLLMIMATQGDILWFFTYQLVLSLIEQVVFTRKLYQLLPRAPRPIKWLNRAELKRIAPFAISIGYTAGVWIFITQLDKLLLSKVLPLSHYGYFALIATISAGIMTLSWPVSLALMPRMTALLAKNQEAEMLSLYCKATRLVACIATPVTIMIACFPAEVIYIWTGDRQAAAWSAPILPLYILGYGILTVEAFQYYLQYAHGRMKLHVQQNTFSALVSLPLIAFAAFRFGPVGVGWVWLGFRVALFTLWTPVVHKVFAPGLHSRWLANEVMLPVGISALVLAIPAGILEAEFPIDRLSGFVTLTVIIGITTLIALSVSFNQEIRDFHRARLQLR